MNAVQKTNPDQTSTVFDVMVAEEAKNGKTYWHNIGVGFSLANGAPGLSLKLQMFPALRIFVKERIRSTDATKIQQQDADVSF